MRYRSKKGTVINIPDGLTERQIASIKADADAGYGTRAQETANRLGTALAAGQQQEEPPAAFSTEGKTAAELQEMLRRTEAEIQKRGGAEKATGYASRLQQIQAALAAAAPAEQDPAAQEPPIQQTPAPDPQLTNTPAQDPGGTVGKGTVGNKGTVDPVKAADDVSKAETNDINTNFNLSQPRIITDENGNTREVVRNPDGTVTVRDTAGGTSKTFKDLATAAAETFNGSVSRQRAEEATYSTLTRYYDRDMSREMEEQKQELANRGIPYDPAAANDPNTKNLYGKTIGSISEKYRGLKDQASQQAVLAGNQAYATDASARDSFLNAVINGASTFGGKFGTYNNTVSTDQSQDTKDILALSADAYMKKYGIDQDTYTKKLAIAKSGGGGGGGGGGSAGGGFEIVG